MSDETVCRLLSEAAEYLKKLGNNLKVRSESLKDKRIRKDKLKNTHSVQKAISKILTICDLSKKSLEHVETGVKGLLTEVGSSSDQRQVEPCNYHLYKIKSKEVKIPPHVHLKHWLSCQVVVKNMPPAELENYKVLYNCKLYRRREKWQKRQNTHVSDSLKNISKTISPSKLKAKENNSDVDSNAEPIIAKKASKSFRFDSDVEEHNFNKQNKGKENNGLNNNTNKHSIVSISESDDNENVDIKKVAENNEQGKNIQLIKCVDITKLLKPEILVTDEKLPSKTVPKDLINKKIILNKPSRGVYYEKSNPKKDENCFQKRQEVKKFKSKGFDVKLCSLPKFTNNFMLSHNINKITHNNNVVFELNKDNVDNLKQVQNNISKVVCDKTAISELSTVNLICSDDDGNAHRKESEPSNNESFNKVLASEDISSCNSELNVKRSDIDKNKIKFKNKIKKKQLRRKKTSVLYSSDNSNSNELIPKGKKRGSANKIIHEEIIDENLKKAKNALLDSSDDDTNSYFGNKDKTTAEKNNTSSSDNLDNRTVKDFSDNEKQKKTIQVKLNNVQSEHQNGNMKSSFSQCDKPADINSSNGSVNDNTESSCHEDDAEKSITNPTHKRIKHSEATSRQTKRKHIMEVMEAKRMLLTYSSSSDTDDELLKNALNGIKDEILIDISSRNQNQVKDSIKNKVKRASRILNSSSDSEPEQNIVKDKKDGTQNTRCYSSEQDTKESSQERNTNNSDSSDGKMSRSKVKTSGSGNQSSETEASFEKEVLGLVDLKTLTRSRRRKSPSSTDTDMKKSPITLKIVKKDGSSVPVISKESLLKEVSSSSDEVSEAGGDEEIQAPLSNINGSGIGHLSKQDLLEDSDGSSSSNSDDKSEKSEDKKDDETYTDSDNPKSKRRKANTISSDSEGGAANKKSSKRTSDFEDSEAESSEPTKRNKRKKKSAQSDDSVGSSGEDKDKKKRRRIKQVSEPSGSESENEGRKHGRKNIRRVMGKDQLEEATKKAARQEKERIARISERQKLYNNLAFDESGKPDEVVLDKVILDFDPETKEPLIQVDCGLVKKLKPHQANGIKFMWDACFESVKRIKKDKGSGCILAHCMGLGKTLQVVSLTHTLLTHSELTGVHRILVVCPLSTVLNWVNEYRMWLKHAESDMEVDIYELSRYKQNSERAYQLQEWLDNGGVCVLGYEMFRNLSADNNKKFRKKMLKSFQESLLDPGPDLVVCDEGHLLKNEKTSLSQSMNRVKTLRRIVLTGTPLQNNLKEYYCMVQFVKPNLLGKYNEYLNRFVNPITNGQYTDSTEYDIKVMKRRSHVLHKMLDGAVQRRDYGVLAPFLPPKHEYVLFITLTDVQVKLYQHYLDNYSRRPLAGKSSGFLFPDFQSLQRIWTHPLVLKYNSERYCIMQQKKRDREEEDSEGSLADFIDDDSTPEESTTEESTDDLSDVSDDSRKKKKKKNKKKKEPKPRRGTRANPVEMAEEDEKKALELEEVKNENPTEWWIPLVTDDELDDLRNSHKLILLFDILRQCEGIGDKVLVFSQSLYSLDLIEHFLGKIDEATQEGKVDEKLGNHVGSWSPGIDYFRLDGSTSCENRSIWCKNFNREDNPRARLFLISTRAGGLGINLVAANRVVIFDVSWNPSHDVQSIFRVYRFGQKKPCYVYRFLAMGTMEEKIYERQVTKQAISKRVIDEQQIDRHYAENDLAELYNFEPRPPEPRPLPPLPKDRLFAEMLREHDKQIYKYHEHDSLLENKEEETLTEEERKAAWEDFENEKNKPPPVPFNAWPMHNGMAGMMAQQQQQMAYAALAAMMRKEQPNITETQLAAMLPILYNSNPAMFGGYDYGLMQKMSEAYLKPYSGQPSGMMNPMMNPVLNAGAMGGTSGLQYEPPWQRQQQQQQQMRLQQLMQHQNSMGQKYYAGGLGSRDPVAMAMQQQRAREMLLGESAPRGRPRGRPPLHARPPPTTTGDIVDLDSD